MRSFTSLKNQSIEDIIQTGFVYLEEQPAEMIVNRRTLFLDIGKYFIQLSSMEEYAQLKFEITDNLTFDTHDLEDALYPAKVSVAALVLTDTMADNRIISLKAYAPEEKPGSITCLALSIRLACGQELFIDPTFYFGLNIGGPRQKACWLENLAVTHPGFSPKSVELAL